MGRGKSWSREESEAVARAWKQASEVFPSREHNSKRFANELYKRFLALAPGDPASLDGRWTSRSQTAVKTQFDTIAEDVLKFNVVLLSILEQASSRGVSTSDDKILRAAVAVHQGGLTETVDFDNLTSKEGDWKLFEAWKVLKTCSRFAPSNWPKEQSNPTNGHSQNGKHVNRGNQNVDSRSAPLEPQPPPFMQGSTTCPPGGTPMRTLASAALSMPLASTTAHEMASLEHSPSADGPSEHQPPEAGATANGPRRHQPPQRMEKRRHEDMFDTPQAHKEPRLQSLDMLLSNSNALELIGEALHRLGDALSEYNALSFFTRPDMEGRHDQKLFFEMLAEKHVMKARMERDKLHDMQNRRNNNHGSNTFSD